MQVVEKRLTELLPYENNPRKNDAAIPYVKESIKRYGFKVPLVIDKNNVIVAGHTRYLASIELGLDTVPCVVADDLTEEEIKEFRLVDNKTSEFAGWDFGLLNEELESIDFGDFDFQFPEAGHLDIDDFFEHQADGGVRGTEKYKVVITFNNENDRDECFEELYGSYENITKQ